MKRPLLTALAILTLSPLRADDDTPVPPEIQALAEAFVSALKSGDDTALLACWHTPETLAKLEEAQELAEGSTPEEAAKDYQREIKNQQRDHAVILHRAASIRAFITKNLGDLAALKLTQVELDLDDDAPADQPTYDDVDLHLTTADGTPIEISIDDAVQLNGTWKFKDRLEERIAITLPNTPD